MEYINTVCAICETSGNTQEIYPENLDSVSTTPEVFSARRIPDRRFYRWVKCLKCGLYRSDPILDVNLSDLYTKSTFDYGAEVNGLKKSYSRLVRKVLVPGKPMGGILEIGGGNGFFLEEALEMGFSSIYGVEPSQSAVDTAPPNVRRFMKCSMFDEKSVSDEFADVIVIFHTLDHLEKPLEVLRVASKKLKPDGRIVIAVHNVRAFSALLLKSRSPIFDIEHTFLFSRKTLAECLIKAGYVDIKVGSYPNYYSLAYIAHLIPLPINTKRRLMSSSLGRFLSRIKIWIPLGNLYASAKRS